MTDVSDVNNGNSKRKSSSPVISKYQNDELSSLEDKGSENVEQPPEKMAKTDNINEDVNPNLVVRELDEADCESKTKEDVLPESVDVTDGLEKATVENTVAECSQLVVASADENTLHHPSDVQDAVMDCAIPEECLDVNLSSTQETIKEEIQNVNIQLEEPINNVTELEENKVLPTYPALLQSFVNTQNTENFDKDLSEENLVITIKFHKKHIADKYKHRFHHLLKTFKEFNYTSKELEINVSCKDIDGPKSRRKKQKNDDLFVVDKTPSINTKEMDVKYVSKYTVITQHEKENATKKGEKPSNSCFNCNEDHNLRDCPHKKDYSKINAARKKITSLQLKARYHLDEDQKYSHLQPGKISTQLKEALGMKENELPPYVYKMRKLGYPPGWMEEAKIVHSNILLYDIHGNEETKIKEKIKCVSNVDPNKIIEYPGFNAPMEERVKDDYKYYDCPPYSEKCSKEAMIAYLKKLTENLSDNLENCDMDLDESENAEETTLPPGCEEEKNDLSRLSPSLVDLEKKKLELLAELDSGSSNSNSSNEKQDSGNNKEKEESVELEQSVPTKSTVKISAFGTPIIKSASPYNTLPDPDKFSKDISPIINFENLPNATGKYEQMTNVLQKVRRTMKNISDK